MAPTYAVPGLFKFLDTTHTAANFYKEPIQKNYICAMEVFRINDAL